MNIAESAPADPVKAREYWLDRKAKLAKKPMPPDFEGKKAIADEFRMINSEIEKLNKIENEAKMDTVYIQRSDTNRSNQSQSVNNAIYGEALDVLKGLAKNPGIGMPFKVVEGPGKNSKAAADLLRRAVGQASQEIVSMSKQRRMESNPLIDMRDRLLESSLDCYFCKGEGTMDGKKCKSCGGDGLSPKGKKEAARVNQEEDRKHRKDGLFKESCHDEDKREADSRDFKDLFQKAVDNSEFRGKGLTPEKVMGDTSAYPYEIVKWAKKIMGSNWRPTVKPRQYQEDDPGRYKGYDPGRKKESDDDRVSEAGRALSQSELSEWSKNRDLSKPMEVIGYALKGTDKSGRTVYYTGRSGDGWVQSSSWGSFFYDTQGEAQRKADMFNKNTSLHGINFTVAPLKDHPAKRESNPLIEMRDRLLEAYQDRKIDVDGRKTTLTAEMQMAADMIDVFKGQFADEDSDTKRAMLTRLVAKAKKFTAPPQLRATLNSLVKKAEDYLASHKSESDDRVSEGMSLTPDLFQGLGGTHEENIRDAMGRAKGDKGKVVSSIRAWLAKVEKDDPRYWNKSITYYKGVMNDIQGGKYDRMAESLGDRSTEAGKGRLLSQNEDYDLYQTADGFHWQYHNKSGVYKIFSTKEAAEADAKKHVRKDESMDETFGHSRKPSKGNPYNNPDDPEPDRYDVKKWQAWQKRNPHIADKDGKYMADKNRKKESDEAKSWRFSESFTPGKRFPNGEVDQYLRQMEQELVASADLMTRLRESEADKEIVDSFRACIRSAHDVFMDARRQSPAFSRRAESDAEFDRSIEAKYCGDEMAPRKKEGEPSGYPGNLSDYAVRVFIGNEKKTDRIKDVEAHLRDLEANMADLNSRKATMRNYERIKDQKEKEIQFARNLIAKIKMFEPLRESTFYGQPGIPTSNLDPFVAAHAQYQYARARR